MSRHPITFPRFLAAWGVTMLVIATLDSLWLDWLAVDFYRRELGTLMSGSVRIVPAVLHYLTYPVAIIGLALFPLPTQWCVAALRSAGLGLTAFGVYDLTNLATMPEYTVMVATVDMAWGTFATTLGGLAAYSVLARNCAVRQTAPKDASISPAST